MSSGTIDLRKAISGSSNEGTWNFDNKKYPFSISEESPYQIEWTESFPPGQKGDRKQDFYHLLNNFLVIVK
jgi:hypothetical protein